MQFSAQRHLVNEALVSAVDPGGWHQSFNGGISMLSQHGSYSSSIRGTPAFICLILLCQSALMSDHLSTLDFGSIKEEKNDLKLKPLPLRSPFCFQETLFALMAEVHFIKTRNYPGIKKNGDWEIRQSTG